jgi:hypothetical protein
VSVDINTSAQDILDEKLSRVHIASVDASDNANAPFVDDFQRFVDALDFPNN